MKIIVDMMPEKPEKCKLHGGTVDGKYICKITNKKCALETGMTCRVLKPLSDCSAAWR